MSRPDALMLASGLLTDVELSPAAVLALDNAASAFVAAGGRVTLTEYAMLSEASRGALRRATARWVAFQASEALTGAVDREAVLEAADAAAAGLLREVAP